jgi:hypothetical protein
LHVHEELFFFPFDLDSLETLLGEFIWIVDVNDILLFLFSTIYYLLLRHLFLSLKIFCEATH